MSDVEENLAFRDFSAIAPQSLKNDDRDGSKAAASVIIDLTLSEDEEAVPQKPNQNQRVSFGTVMVFDFPREQGNTCVPSEAGFSLGMGAHHSEAIEFSIEEHAMNSGRKSPTYVDPESRRVLLKNARVPTNVLEENECANIRFSRGTCGCKCKRFCEPETCSCCQTEINCLVDCSRFPCSCTRNNCGNPFGRKRFDRKKVRAHLDNTLRREKEEQET